MSSLGVGELTADIYTAEGHRTKCHTVSDMRDQGLVPIYKNSKVKNNGLVLSLWCFPLGVLILKTTEKEMIFFKLHRASHSPSSQ